MPSCDWRAYSEATRGRLINGAWVAGAAVVLGLLYLWGYWGPSDGQPQRHHTEEHCEYAKPQGDAKGTPPRPAVLVCLQIDAADKGRYASTEEGNGPKQIVPLSRSVARRIVSDPVALFSLVLATLTWRLIVVGRYQHKAAMSALDLANAEFVSAHRPWVPDSVSIVSPLTFDSHGAHLTVRFMLKNTGTWPATQVLPSVRLEPEIITGEAGNRVTNLNREVNRGADDMGVTVFPGEEPFPFDVGVMMSPEKMNEGRLGVDNAFYLRIFLVGALVYRGLNGAKHQTGIAYEIAKVNRPGPPQVLMINVADGDVSVADLRFTKGLIWQTETT